MTSKTPRTDAFCKEYPPSDYPYDWPDFARSLELELSRTREALREALDNWHGQVDYMPYEDMKADAERISAIRKELKL